MDKLMLSYHNRLNTVILSQLKPIEFNIFFALAKQVADSDENTEHKVVFDFDDFRKIAELDKRKAPLSEDIMALRDTLIKMSQLRFDKVSKGGLSVEGGVLFTYYEIDVDTGLVTVMVNPKQEYLLRNLMGEFTRVDLLAMNRLRSIYAKEAYRHLSQFKSTGKWSVSLEDFRDMLSIPKEYTMREITSSIINRHILKELTPLFPNLRVEKKKKGREVVGLTFLFDSGVIETEGLVVAGECPHCGKTMYVFNKRNGETFVAHKKADAKNCHGGKDGKSATFSSIAELEKANPTIMTMIAENSQVEQPKKESPYNMDNLMAYQQGQSVNDSHNSQYSMTKTVKRVNDFGLEIEEVHHFNAKGELVKVTPKK